MKSYFDGGLFQLIGLRLLGVFMTICTLGICYPYHAWHLRILGLHQYQKVED